MLPPAGTVTVAAMLPVPEAVKLVPADPVAVQLTPPKTAGKLSATLAPTASDGPLLLTTIVYMSDDPGTCDVLPSSFVTTRLELSVIVSVSVAELLVVGLSLTPAGAVTVAVFTSDPVADDFTVPPTVNVAVPPETRLTETEMLPVPEAGHEEPAEATQLQLTAVKSAGNVSATDAPVTSEGPLLVT